MTLKGHQKATGSKICSKGVVLYVSCQVTIISFGGKRTRLGHDELGTNREESDTREDMAKIRKRKIGDLIVLSLSLPPLLSLYVYICHFNI